LVSIDKLDAAISAVEGAEGILT